MIVMGLTKLFNAAISLEWDDIVSFQLLVFVVVCLLSRYLISIHRMRKLPPGPLGVPLLGYIPFMGSNVHLSFTKLSQTYGPIYRLFMGNKLLVVLTDHKIIREAFSKEVFSGRPSTELTEILGGYGVINTEGDLWKEQRKFIHEKLRNFGARNSNNRDQLETRITSEVRNVLRVLRNQASVTFDMHALLASSLSNVICSMLMSVRFGHRDPKFLRFLHLMDEGLRLFSLTAPVNFVAALRHVPGVNWAYKKLIQNKDEMFQFFREMVDQHKATLDPENIRDFVDEYLLEMQRLRSSGHKHHFSEEQLYQVIGDMFSAGLEPVKDTLQWALLYMITNPETQSKVQEELDAIVGKHRLPSCHDLPFLPFTEATIMEIQRMGNVLAIGTSRAATQNTTLCGFDIPKNAHIIPSLWTVHMNPDNWKNPETFDPSRFIDKSGRVVKPDYFIPFSTGRRMCIGDVLAKMEIFLFLSSILHQFDLSIPEGEPFPSLEGVSGITRTPSRFQIRASLRQTSLCTEDYYGNS